MSVRFESDVARQAGKAALAAADRRRDLVDRREVDVPRDPAGRGVVDRPLAPGRPGDRPTADPVADATRRRAVRGGGARLCDLCHRSILSVEGPTILLVARGPARRRPVRTAVGSAGRARPGRARSASAAAARPRPGSRRRIVRMTNATPQPTAMASAMRPPAFSPAATTGSRHVVETAARARAHSPIRDEEQASVAPPEPAEHQHERQPGQDRQRRDALERLRRDRRQRRSERAPRSGTEVGGRPGVDARDALAGAGQDHRQLAGADREQDRRGRRRAATVRSRRPSRLAT